jgi:heme/copper-type cytochrome/quinol oxidase subunit 2
MKGMLVVDTPEEYQAWLKERAELAGGGQSAPPAPAPKTENKPSEPAPSPSHNG